MLTSGLIVLLCLVASSVNGQSRNVARSGEFGDVNLVEFNIRGVTYGRCTYNENGEDLELLYEDRAGEISAKSMNPTVADPISKTQICREVATRPVPSSPSQFRTSLGEGDSLESPQDLQFRLEKFQEKLSSNEVYLSYLRPRFLSDMMNNIGILVGGNSGFNGIGVHLPNNANSNKDQVNLHLGGFKPFGWGR